MATIKLQGIHTPQKAIPAAELKPGMITVWNYGYTSTSLHRHNKTAVQGKSQSHNAKIVSHTYNRKESAIHFSLLKF